MSLFRRRKKPVVDAPGGKLAEYLGRGREYLVYIGVPCSQPETWIQVQGIQGGDVVCCNGERHRLHEVRSTIIAYPNGEILDATEAFSPFPDGIRTLDSGQATRHDTLDTAKLADGARFLIVVHGKTRRGSGGKLIYPTSLTNVSKEPIRVLRFGGYAFVDGQWQLNTVSGDYYSDEQFRAWYGMDDGEWIEPGQTVCDPDNYGGPDAIWAYLCTTESGIEFLAGAKLA